LSDLQILQNKLGFSFNDSSLLQQAFTHSSYVNEHSGSAMTDNERLEFLGDAVLNIVVTEEIYNRFEHFSEGKLTEIRSILNREETLSQMADNLNLGEHLQMSKGEKASGGDLKKSNLANTFEALIGAIYLDRGIDYARSFILNSLEPHLVSIENGDYSTNYKGLLQEYTQGQYKKLPAYHTVNSEGPDHEKTFTVEVSLDDKTLARGYGKSKRSAEMSAAEKAYKKLSQNSS
jgi:ribonuclease III